jgi:pleiotropic regulator 1
VASLKCQEADPQIMTGSMDSTIRLWDLAAGKTMATLTHHKKSVRALVKHPTEFTFASASPDNIKQWQCPEGKFIQNLEGHRAIVNTMSLNNDNVLFSGGDNGSMRFWDWKSGYNFQTMDTIVQPGSLESESGIFASTFDHTGSRLITCEADKTIKIWKEDETAVRTFVRFMLWFVHVPDNRHQKPIQLIGNRLLSENGTNSRLRFAALCSAFACIIPWQIFDSCGTLYFALH